MLRCNAVAQQRVDDGCLLVNALPAAYLTAGYLSYRTLW